MRGSKTEVSPGVWRLRVFTGRYRSNGSPIVVSRTVRAAEHKQGAGSRMADRELANLVTSVSQGKVPIGNETVAEFLNRWVQHLESIARSPVYVRECRYKIDTIVNPELGRLHLSKLTARHLDLLYRKMTDRGLKPRTVRTVHAVLSAALHQAEKWDLVDRPVTTRATPPTVHADQVVAPTPAEVRKLLDQAETVDPALAALLLIAALTGARRGELCALRWSDLNWQAGVLTIARSVYEVEGGGWAEKSTKTHQSRRVGLDELGLAVLRRHRGNVEKLAAELELPIGADAFMFSQSPTGLEPYRPNHVTQFTRRMAKMAGVKTHVHGLRHFSATQLIAGGYDVRTVAGRLGHADASVTLRVYSHVLPERDLGVGGELRIGYAIGAKFPPAAGIAKAVRVRSEGYAREKVLGGRHQVLRRVQVSLFAKDRHRFKGDWPVSVQTDREING